MKTLIFALSTLAVVGVTPISAQAADLDGYNGGYIDRGPVVERPPVREYYDGPVVTYYSAPRYYRPYPYWAGYYPYGGYGYWGRPYYRGGYWGYGRGWHGHWGGHRGWR